MTNSQTLNMPFMFPHTPFNISLPAVTLPLVVLQHGSDVPCRIIWENRYTHHARITFVGRDANEIHMITEGIVELVYNDIVVNILNAGQAITEDFYLQEDTVYARAKGQVKTLSANKEDCNELKLLFDKKMKEGK